MRIACAARVVFVAVLLSACQGESPEAPPEASSDADHDDRIAWFDGSVEEAFATAARQDRPVFLYWGAVWCPPCYYLKTKVLQREEFVEASRNFVMVYLDGDTERAQIVGERFAFQGYPTVILFGSDGDERMRMPSTLPVERYAEVLDAAVGMRPIAAILDDVLRVGPAAADAGDLYLLSFYSWGQDERVGLDADARLATFTRLHDETPEARVVERSRFLSLRLRELASRGEAEAPLLDEPARQALLEEVRRLLADPSLVAANLDLVNYYGGETVSLLTEAGSTERETLVADWTAVARGVEEDETLTVSDRIYALLPQLALAGMEQPGDATVLPDELLDRVRQRAAWAMDTVDDGGELQAVMNATGGVLEEAGLGAEVEEMIQARIADTEAPWYFMSWLGSIKAEQGETDEALSLYRSAYDAAEGRYTRFRWGSIYLRQRLALAPDDVARIEADSEEILGELLTFEDAFSLGNHSRLGQLDRAYRQWNEDGSHDESVAGFRDLVHASCPRFEAGGEAAQGSRCEAFLAERDATAAL